MAKNEKLSTGFGGSTTQGIESVDREVESRMTRAREKTSGDLSPPESIDSVKGGVLSKQNQDGEKKMSKLSDENIHDRIEKKMAGGEKETTPNAPGVQKGGGDNSGGRYFYVEHKDGSKKEFYADEGEHAAVERQAADYYKRNLPKKKMSKLSDEKIHDHVEDTLSIDGPEAFGDHVEKKMAKLADRPDVEAKVESLMRRIGVHATVGASGRSIVIGVNTPADAKKVKETMAKVSEFYSFEGGGITSGGQSLHYRVKEVK